MATLEDKHITSAFAGLATQGYVALGIAGVGVVTFETLRRLKRPTIRVRRGQPDAELTSEDYAMTGYLYQARAFVPFRPVKMHGLWPLAWVWSVVRTRTSDIALRSGVDSAAYVCVLNGVWLFAVSQLLTTFPVLLALHLHFSPSSYAPTDLNRASLSALVSDKDNVHLLFVHVLLLWWMTLAFYLTIIRIGRQILRLRRLVLRDESQNQAQHVPQDASHRGWRHRTLLVTNIPTEMRSEEKLTAYFDDMLKLPRVQAAATSATTPSTDKKTVNPNHNKGKVPVQIAPKPAYPPTPAAHPVRRLSDHENPISRIVLVRRTGELHETFKKREDALHQLEKAHAQLAVNVLRATKRHLNRTRSTQAPQPNSAEEKSTEDVEMDFIAQKLQPYLDPLQSNNNKSIWEALSELPKDMLDPFQPTRALKVFKDQRVAELDYWVAKFNLYSVLLDDLRASPRDSFKPTPTAFVTFNSAAQARRLAQQVPHHPERVWACLLERAPDTRDLVWDKLAASSFRGDALRSVVVQTLVWAFILIWVIPVGFLLSLVSLNNLAAIIPALDKYLSANPDQKSLFSSLVPTVLLSVLLFLVPTLLIQLSNRAQHFITVSKLHHTVLCRYHAFLITDVVVIFCAGRTALESLFREPGKVLAADSLLNRIASAFPAGAPFFIGWQIIVTGVHPFFELMLLGFPLINQIGVATAGSLRKRLELALPRSINIYSVLPTHLVVLCIFHVFALLNPLIVCFGALYWTVSLIVFKRSFAMYYWRRNYDLNGTMIFIRFMRYSLDGLMLSQVVLIALLWVSRFSSGGAACIPPLILTFFFKLAATRVFGAYSAILDVEEADVIAGGPQEQQLVETLRVPLAPAFLKNTWPFKRITFKLRVNRDQKQQKRRDAIVKAQEKEKEPGHRPLPVRSRSNPNSMDPEARPILRRISSELEASEESHAASPVSPVLKRRQTPPQKLPDLVTPHGKLVERDDRTDFSAQYDNPFLTAETTTHLWLPRDPLLPIDLNDSVDYYGLALVSSRGGNGRLGTWEEPNIADELVQSPHTADFSGDLTGISEDQEGEQEHERLARSPPASPKPQRPGRPRRSTVTSILSVQSNKGEGRDRSLNLGASVATTTSMSLPPSPTPRRDFGTLKPLDDETNNNTNSPQQSPHITFDPRASASTSSQATPPRRPTGLPPSSSSSSPADRVPGNGTKESLGVHQPSARASAVSVVSRRSSLRCQSPSTHEEVLKEAVLEEWRAEELRAKKKRKNSTVGTRARGGSVSDVEQQRNQDELEERQHERAADRSWFRGIGHGTHNVVDAPAAATDIPAPESESPGV